MVSFVFRRSLTSAAAASSSFYFHLVSVFRSRRLRSRHRCYCCGSRLVFVVGSLASLLLVVVDSRLLRSSGKSLFHRLWVRNSPPTSQGIYQ